MNKKPRILLYDIETSPLISYTWGIWEQNVIEVKEEWYILSFGYKWLGEKKVHFYSLPDYELYKKEPKNDRELMKSLWKLFDEADIVVGHNSSSFDNKKTNSRFIQHGLLPPTPFKTVDTLKIARKYFKFDSNKLDHLGQYFKIGRKVKHEGFSLWLGCMAGDKKSWKKMGEYNIQDVVLLEKVYHKMLPYMTDHPHMGLLIDGSLTKCRNCGSTNTHKRGFGVNSKTRYQRVQCQNCGMWDKGENIRNEKTK